MECIVVANVQSFPCHTEGKRSRENMCLMLDESRQMELTECPRQQILLKPLGCVWTDHPLTGLQTLRGMTGREKMCVGASIHQGTVQGFQNFDYQQQWQKQKYAHIFAANAYHQNTRVQCF